MARCFALVLALLVVVAVTSALADDSIAEGPMLGVLTPIATSPLPSDAGAADGPNMMDDSDVGGVGAPLGTTMTEPEADSTTTSGQTADQASTSAAATVTSSVAVVAAITVVAASCFVF